MLSLKKNFLFIHVPKTGGNSIQNILKDYSEDQVFIAQPYQDGVERFEIRNPEYRTQKHSSLAEYKSLLPGKHYKSLFKIATLRNPWDMMISHYFSPHFKTTEWDESAFLSLMERTQTLRHYIGIPPRFPALHATLHLPTPPVDRHLDFLIRFESLDQDFQILCQKLSIPHTPLPVRNKSNRVHYSSYYTPKLAEQVRRKFHEEIELGRYTFQTL